MSAVEADTAPPCPACGGESFPILPGLFRFVHDPYFACGGCGLWHTAPDGARLAGFYSRDYADLPHKAAEPQGRIACFTAFFPRLARYAPGPRLLDVGTGSGHFLALAAGLGFEAFGVEPNATLASEAAARSGRPVHAGTLASLPAGAPFDVVTLWNVLDQVDDPPALLERSAARLAAGGLLFVRIPNGLVHRPLMRLLAVLGDGALGARLRALTPLHPFVLRSRDLAGLLARRGLRVLRLEGSMPSGPPATAFLRRAAAAVLDVPGRLGLAPGPLSPSIEAFARKEVRA